MGSPVRASVKSFGRSSLPPLLFQKASRDHKGAKEQAMWALTPWNGKVKTGESLRWALPFCNWSPTLCLPSDWCLLDHLKHGFGCDVMSRDQSHLLFRTTLGLPISVFGAHITPSACYSVSSFSTRKQRKPINYLERSRGWLIHLSTSIWKAELHEDQPLQQ